jgi:Fic family protein
MGRLWQTVILRDWMPVFEWLPVETMVYQNQHGYYHALALAEERDSMSVFVEYMLSIIAFTLEKVSASQQAKKAVKLAEQKRLENEQNTDQMTARKLTKMIL